MGAVLFLWLGRGACLAVFACGGSELTPPPVPPPFQQVLAGIFVFVVAMILLATVEIVTTQLRDLPAVVGPKKKSQASVATVARGIFSTFGMATQAIVNIRRATIGSPGQNSQRRRSNLRPPQQRDAKE